MGNHNPVVMTSSSTLDSSNTNHLAVRGAIQLSEGMSAVYGRVVKSKLV